MITNTRIYVHGYHLFEFNDFEILTRNFITRKNSTC
jgi:hypothetical protein